MLLEGRAVGEIMRILGAEDTAACHLQSPCFRYPRKSTLAPSSSQLGPCRPPAAPSWTLRLWQGPTYFSSSWNGRCPLPQGLHLLAQRRPLDVLVSPVWAIFNHCPFFTRLISCISGCFVAESHWAAKYVQHRYYERPWLVYGPFGRQTDSLTFSQTPEAKGVASSMGSGDLLGFNLVGVLSIGNPQTGWVFCWFLVNPPIVGGILDFERPHVALTRLFCLSQWSFVGYTVLSIVAPRLWSACFGPETKSCCRSEFQTQVQKVFGLELFTKARDLVCNMFAALLFILRMVPIPSLV